MVTRTAKTPKVLGDAHEQHSVDSVHRLTAMSYEFRTPLTGIIGNVQLLTDELLNNEEAQKYARHIRRSADTLYQVLDSVLEYVNLKAGHTQNAPEYVKLQELLSPLMDSLKLKARKKKVYLKVKWPKPDHAYLDPALFTSIVNHVVDNAIKFTTSGGVQVEITSTAKSVLLVVSDTGIGIQPQSIPNLCIPYWQESQGIARRHRGLGLGLSIVDRTIDVMKGNMRIESTPGVGTKVTVDIPMLNHTEEVDMMEFSTSKRILYVEDDPIIQILARRILKDYLVDVCSTAEEALERVKSVRYDAIVLDIQLGQGMTGQQLCRILREHPDFEHTPIAAATAIGVDSIAQNNPKLFSHYLPKPFHRDQMLQLVEEMTTARQRGN
jgi:CheY-like chemotaxis protein/anti-sigma regulatory factor (Ser/Thr protein kinase)